MHKKPTALIILDGFGSSNELKYNAIAQAKTPHLDAWFSAYPHTLVEAAGNAVGLPSGYIGNSEAGHSTIGAGRIIEQPLTIINNAIQDGSFFTNTHLTDALNTLKKTGNTLHIVGLLSDAGVHSHINHLFAFIEAAVAQGITNIVIHPILDGRDTLPRSAKPFLELLEKKIASIPGASIGSLQGRYYAMDRDQNWDRTEECYRILTTKSEPIKSWQSVLEKAYSNGLSDEFIQPTTLNGSIIKPGDGVILFNFRPERIRQLASAFTDQTFNQFPTQHLDLTFFITPLPVANHKKITALWSPPQVENTLLDVLAAHHYKLFTIAETEKYAHVTYFFSGGKETKRTNETRILIPSIKTKTYEPYPCMSAVAITDAIITSLITDPCDFYLVNYANADMVAHSGNMQATIKAIECLDRQLARIYEVLVAQLGGTLYLTGDHGNAEEMFDKKTGMVKTAHTINPVPFLMINEKYKGNREKLPLVGLKDIAPFILKKLGLSVPEDMR